MAKKLRRQQKKAGQDPKAFVDSFIADYKMRGTSMK